MAGILTRIQYNHEKNIEKRTLRDIVINTTPLSPQQPCNPSSDQNEETTSMFEKWKKKLTAIAMNDTLVATNHLDILYQKEITSNRTTEKEMVNNIRHQDEIYSDAFNKPSTSKMNHFIEDRQIQLPKEQDPINYSGSQSNVTNKQLPPGPTQAKICQDMDLDSQLSSSSMNVLKYITGPKKSFESLEEKMVDQVIIRYPKSSKSFKNELSNEGMISKEKYMKLLTKYRILKGMIRQQKVQHTKDTYIQHIAQCLYKAIKERYSDEEGEDDDD